MTLFVFSTSSALKMSKNVFYDCTYKKITFPVVMKTGLVT